MSIYDCIDRYPILKNILSELSATDVSSFIYAAKIELPEPIKRKYIHFLRDIPEHIKWINDMIEDGNKVMIIGADLKRLIERIRNPERYNRKNETPLCLWLAVIPLEIVRHDSKTSNPNQWHIMTWEGKFEKLSEIEGSPTPGQLLGPPNKGYPSSTFICRFKYMNELPTSGQGSDWFVSNIPNENNINIVYFATYHNGAPLLNPCLQPCVRFNKEAILCHKILTNENVEGDKIWNIPLLKYDDISMGTPALTTAWYDINERTLTKLSTKEKKISSSKTINITLTSDTPFAEMIGEEVCIVKIPFLDR